MNEPTFTTQVNGHTVTCHPNLKGFKIFKKESSNIDYLGTDHENYQLFIQFLTGKCYLFMHIPKEVLDLAESAPSIGKYFYAFIKGKYPEMAVDDHCITAQKDARFVEEEDDEDWDPDEDFAFGDI